MSNTLDKKAIFTNTFWQVVVRFVTLAVTLVSVKILTNYLGEGGYGDFNAITTYINFFIVIADLGLFSVTVREIAKNPTNEKKIISNVFFLRLVSAILACFLAAGIVFLTSYSDAIKFGTLIATGFLLFNLLGSVYDMILQYRLKMQFSALAEFLSKILYIVALIIIVLLHGNFLAVTSIIAISGVGIFIFKWLFSRKFITFSPRYNRETMRWILSLAWPIGIVFIVHNLYFKIDTLLVWYFKGSIDTGIYSVSYRILEVTAFIGSYFASALKPAISKNIQRDKKMVASIIEKGFVIMLIFSIPITIISAVFAKDIILLISSPSFVAGTSALVILAFTLPFIYLDNLLAEVLLANDERKVLLVTASVALTINVILNLIFIPLYSYHGAAWTTLISEVILMLLMYATVKKILPIKLPWMNIWKIVCVFFLSLLAALSFSKFNLNLLLSIVLVGAFYVLLIDLFGLFRARDLRSLVK